MAKKNQANKQTSNQIPSYFDTLARPRIGEPAASFALRQEWRLVSLTTSDPSCLHCTGWGEWKNKQQNLYDMMCTYISAMFMIVAATLQGSLGISPGCEMGLSSPLQNVGAVH